MSPIVPNHPMWPVGTRTGLAALAGHNQNWPCHLAIILHLSPRRSCPFFLPFPGRVCWTLRYAEGGTVCFGGMLYLSRTFQPYINRTCLKSQEESECSSCWSRWTWSSLSTALNSETIIYQPDWLGSNRCCRLWVLSSTLGALETSGRLPGPWEESFKKDNTLGGTQDTSCILMFQHVSTLPVIGMA